MQKHNRVELAHLPTPLERAARLESELGGPGIYIKRDDATGLAGGGNKARKLEFLAADALAQGANCLATVGGIQSNHARMTAALAAQLGLDCRLYLKGEAPEQLQGNLLLDKLLGAELIFCGSQDNAQVYKRIDDDKEKLGRQGVNIYKIPLGGSSPHGALGYVHAMTEELIPQCIEAGFKPDAILMAAGSGGTMAGALLGLALGGWGDVPVLGYSVSASAHSLAQMVADIYKKTADLLAVDCALAADQMLVDDSQIGAGYGFATEAGLEALRLFARRQGVLLDSVYTAKAAAGMIADIRRGKWKQGNIVFVHTGGWPALFAKDDVEKPLREEM